MKIKSLLIIFLLFLTPALRAQTISLVGDLREAGTNYRLMESIEYNRTLYFSTWSDISTVLWKLGPSGPERVYTWPYLAGDYTLNKLYVFNGKMFFTGIDAQDGKELWTSDGTTAGTRMVKDIFRGFASAFAPMGDRLHFSILPYTPFRSLNGKVLFVAKDTTWNNNSKVWETDGTEAGTRELAVVPSDSFNCGFDISVLNQKAWYFAAKNDNDYGFYSTDGTPAGTSEVKHRFWAQDLATYGSNIYFNGSFFGPPINGNYISGFGVSDGTAGGTYYIDSTISYSADHIYYFGHLFFFNARNPGSFFSSIGTKAGTVRIKDFLGYFNNNLTRKTLHQKVHYPVVLNNSIYFCTPTDIYKSDGSNAGTVPINAFVRDSSCTPPIPSSLVVANDRLYFKAWNGGRIEMYTSDGTGGGTQKISMAGADYVDSNYIRCNAFAGTEQTDPIMIFNNQVYYTAIYNKAVGKALYRLNAPTGIERASGGNKALTVFPNPASGSVNIQYPANGYSSVEVYDALGRKLLAEKVSAAGQQQLDASRLAPGSYIIRLVGSAAPLNGRVTISR